MSIPGRRRAMPISKFPARSISRGSLSATPGAIGFWMQEHSPCMTSTIFFRPEYGFELLVQAVVRLRLEHPKIGMLVMGSGEDREQAAALIEEYGLRGVMYLAGDLDHELCLALISR